MVCGIHHVTIPIEQDVTAVVGENESGQSHLLHVVIFPDHLTPKSRLLRPMTLALCGGRL